MTQSQEAPQASPAVPAAPAVPTAVPAAPGQPGVLVTGQEGGPIVVTPGGTIQLPGGASPRAVYRAAREKREVIRDLIERARNRRSEVAGQLRNSQVTGADREGLEARIKEMDARIIDLEKQLVQAENEITQAAGIPGAVVPDRQERSSGPGPDVMIPIASVFTIFVLFPIAVAYARRIWKRTGTAVAQAPTWMNERFARLEQAVDAIAIEVERISEGQRFMTKLFSENGRALGQGAAQPLDVPLRERVPQGSGS